MQVSAKKTRALLARAGKIRRKETQEAETSSPNKGEDKDKGKGKEMRPESLRAPPTRERSSVSSAELKESGPMAKEVGADMGVNDNGKGVAGNEEKGEGKSGGAVNVGSSKGSVRAGDPGDEEKRGVGQDTNKSGDRTVNSFGNITPVITTDKTTKPVADNGKTIPLATAATETDGPEVPPMVVPSSGTPITTPAKNNDATKEKFNPTINDEKAESAPDEKIAKSKGPVVTDEGDVATPKRVTKELPPSPAKSNERIVPALGLMVPKSLVKGSAPTDPTMSPLQKALNDAKGETLMERMARLNIKGSGFQPREEAAPPTTTDLDSECECETAPSRPYTPKSGASASFNLVLRSDVPLSDDDDFFLECGSNASVSNFDGL